MAEIVNDGGHKGVIQPEIQRDLFDAALRVLSRIQDDAMTGRDVWVARPPSVDL